MSLVGALLSAVSGLQTAQAQLLTTSNNIANVNTPGYTRKTTAPETTVVNGTVTGVRLADIQRTVDDGLLRQLREHIARLSGQSVQSGYLDRAQTLFGSPGDNASLSQSLANLGAALDGLAADPDSLANKLSVVDLARVLSEQFARTSQGIQDIRLDAERQIQRSVTTINDVLAEIDSLNKDISRALALGDSAPDLEDRRDVLLTQLANEIDIQYYTRATGEVAISTSSGRLLLDAVPVSLSHTAAGAMSADATLGNGLSGILYGAAGVDITAEIQGGRLGGLLAVRDQTMVDLQAEIDRLAETLRDQINALHNDGTAFPPPTTLTGSRSIAATDAPQMSGTFRVAVVDSAGIVVESLDIDLAALAPTDIGTLVGQINAMANASASINASGQVVISATGGNRIAVNEMNSAVTSGISPWKALFYAGSTSKKVPILPPDLRGCPVWKPCKTEQAGHTIFHANRRGGMKDFPFEIINNIYKLFIIIIFYPLP